MSKNTCLLLACIAGAALITGMTFTEYLLADLCDFHDLDLILGMELILCAGMLGLLIILLFPHPRARNGTYIVLELNRYGTPELIREIQEEDLVFCCRKMFSMEYKILREIQTQKSGGHYMADVKYRDEEVKSFYAPLNRIPTPAEAAKMIVEKSIPGRIMIFRNPHELAEWISDLPEDLQTVYQEVLEEYLRQRLHIRQIL